MRTRLVAVCLVTAACPATTTTTIAPVAPADPIAVPLTAATEITTTVAITRDDLSPPWTLTASDGTGLELTRVAARAVVEGPLAFTELHLYFRNDQDRQREGTFQITLPQRAAVSRFAMEHAGTWMEAEVVPKLAARRAYEDFLHRRQDPALLEKAAGNQFTARVFPIGPRAVKHLVISYSQALPGQRYTLALRGLPRTPQIDVELAFTSTSGTRTTQKLAERDWQPDRDFVATGVATAAAVRAGGSVAAQVEIGPGALRNVPAGITLLVDTSASRSLGFAAYVARIRALARDLRATWGDALPLDVVAFDQDAEQVFDGTAAGFGEPAVKKLLDRGAAGASDIGQALAWLAKREAKKPRIVMIGDGVITAGLEGRDLVEVAKRLGAERVDVVLAGGMRDDRAAQLLVRSLARSGAVLDLELDPVARALGESVAVDIPIDVPGASWVYPRRIASARAGSKVMVYAKVPGTSFTVTAGATRSTLHPLAGTGPLVERAIAGAEIAELEARVPSLTGDAAGALRTTIANKSVASRVLSSETSMLVLESESDYPRYGIDRKALADVLVVGPRGVERLARGTPAPIAPGGKPITTDTVEPRGPDKPAPAPGPAPPAAPGAGGDVDRDGILDSEDRCPSEPETRNGLDDDDGCPDRGRVIVSDASVVILEPVLFQSQKAVIQGRSIPILDAVAATLAGNPDIALLEVQGHTDTVGDRAYNLQLSQWRADAVLEYLVRKGVDRRRLTAQGYGAELPIDRRTTELAHAKNRRVDFLILRRGDSDATTARPRIPAKAPRVTPPPAVTGELATIQSALGKRDLDGALATARAWHAREPGNVLALIGLGEALEARRAIATAARVYGSIIDLYPGRADLRRFAGERLAKTNANHLEIDTLRRAVADRPDHLTGHRLLAYAYVRAGRHADAFAAILAGLAGSYREGSYAGGMRVLGEDASMIGAVYATTVPAKRADIVKALASHKLALATKPSTRFVLYWESDANDVDLHVHDARGDHASYRQPKLASGGELYADVTRGYGPECFAIPGTPVAGPYRLEVEYYEQGPMGFGMGMLEIQRFDPRRGMTFEHRPYVITSKRATVDLGLVR